MKKKSSNKNKRNINKEPDKNNNKKMLINGPVNFFKLVSNNKSVYIFMDFHYSINIQRNCDNVDSKDIDKYVYNLLKTNKKEPIDFFLEIAPTKITIEDKSFYNGIYIDNMRKKFKKIYTELYPNLDETTKLEHEQTIRLHYIDIRDYAYFYEIFKIIEMIINDLNNNYIYNLTFIISELNAIVNILKIIDNMVQYIINPNKEAKNELYESYSKIEIDFINIKEKNIKQVDPINNDRRTTNNTNNTTNTTNTNDKDINTIMDIGLYKLLQKILLNYSDEKNSDKIKSFFIDHYVKTSNYLIKNITQLIENLNQINSIIDANNYNNIEYSNIKFIDINKGKTDGSYYVDIVSSFNARESKELYRNILDQLYEYDQLTKNMSCIITDCYFLRRLIDNKSITKSIVYTGAYHSTIYIWFLILQKVQ